MNKQRKAYDRNGKVLVSHSDRLNLKPSRMDEGLVVGNDLPRFRQPGEKVPHQNRVEEFKDTFSRSGQRTGDLFGWNDPTVDVRPRRRRFKIARHAFGDPIHLDKSPARLRGRFSQLFVLGGLPKVKRYDREMDVHRNRMYFLAFVASLALYVLVTLLSTP
ncbi:MAG: hypothetical protein ACI9TH_000807 [Kiritimatiellia bacterium]|jgi:hypothetical protein